MEKAHKTFNSNDKEMVMKSFDACGIITKDPLKVRSGPFYEQCVVNANSILEDEADLEENEDDPFDLYFF